MPSKKWTPDDINVLNSAWLEGLSATEIGLMLGRTSDSVANKVHETRLSFQKYGKKARFVVPAPRFNLIDKSMKTFWSIRKMQIAMEQNS